MPIRALRFGPLIPASLHRTFKSLTSARLGNYCAYETPGRIDNIHEWMLYLPSEVEPLYKRSMDGNSSPDGFEPLQNDLLLRTARGEKVERPPCWVMRQAGRYLPEYHEEKGNADFFECCRSPEIASNLTLQPIDRYSGLIDAAIIFSDILVIPQAMGMEVVMVPEKGPNFPEPLGSPEDRQYHEVMEREVDVKESLGYVYKAITLTRQKLKGRVPLYGFCGAPFTLLCYMVEGGGSKIFKQTKTWIFKYPTESKRLLRKMAELCVGYLAQQVVAGAQIVQVFDSWAGELSPSSFKEFAMPYLEYICNHLPKRLQELSQEIVPMVVFAKGAWYALEDLCKTKYNVIGLDWLHDPAEAYKVAQKHGKVLQGNADPGVLYGGHEAITNVVGEMVEGFGGGKQGWIANLGHGITPFVQPDDLKFFFQEIHRLSDVYQQASFPRADILKAAEQRMHECNILHSDW